MSPQNDDRERLAQAICRFGSLLYMRGYAHGASGNISVRLSEGILITPTNTCLGLLEPHRLSLVDSDGRHVDGDPPSKEAFLHLAIYHERPGANAVVHLHCTHAVAVACCAHHDASNVLPPLTAYHVMRVGRVPLVPYHRPGDLALATAVGQMAASHHSLLLANHGPVVAGRSLEDAVFAIEELEETAKLSLLLRDSRINALTSVQVAELERDFPS